MKRKFYFVGLFWAVFVLSSCLNSQPLIASKADKVILEIVSTTNEMVYPKGDILIMSLYQSGRFEYDDYPDYNPPETRDAVTIRKESKLKPEEVNELINLATQPDFLSANETYPELLPKTHTDVFILTKIKFSYNNLTKTIKAENFWHVLLYSKDRTKYASSMIKLLERAREIKAKVTGKTFDKYL